MTLKGTSDRETFVAPVELAGWVVRQHKADHGPTWVLHISTDEKVRLPTALLARLDIPVSVVTGLYHMVSEKSSRQLLGNILKVDARQRCKDYSALKEVSWGGIPF